MPEPEINIVKQIMRYLIFILLIIFVSCSREMTNDEIIKEVKKCKDAGMDYSQYENLDGSTRAVKCR